MRKYTKNQIYQHFFTKKLKNKVVIQLLAFVTFQTIGKSSIKKVVAKHTLYFNHPF